MHEHVFGWSIPTILPNRPEPPTICATVGADFPQCVESGCENECTFAGYHSFAGKISLSGAKAPQGKSEGSNNETSECCKKAVVRINEPSGAQRSRTDRDYEGVGILVGLVGGLFGAIFVYAGVKRLCKIKFSHYKRGQQKNNSGQQW